MSRTHIELRKVPYSEWTNEELVEKIDRLKDRLSDQNAQYKAAVDSLMRRLQDQRKANRLLKNRAKEVTNLYESLLAQQGTNNDTRR